MKAVVKNIHDGTLGFKDDDKVVRTLKPGETVECNYKKSMDPRLIIEPKKKKGVKENGDN